MPVDIYCSNCEEELATNSNLTSIGNLVAEHDAECPENSDNQEEDDE